MDREIEHITMTCMVRFEEILFQELSNLAHPKVEYVGVDFLKKKNIQGALRFPK